MSFLHPDLRCLTGRSSGDSADHDVTFAVDRFLEPVHLVGLAAVAQAEGRAGRTCRLAIAGDHATYASRMRLGSALDLAGCEHDLPGVRERVQTGRLLEVTGIDGPNRVRDLAALVRERVRRRSPHVGNALYSAICEMGLNVHEHAHSDRSAVPMTGFVAAQTMHRTHEVVFAVADSGAGLLGTLRSRGARDHSHAIELASTGMSRFADEVTRGLGIPDTIKLVTELGGSFFLATGTATSATDHERRWQQGTITRYPGTILQARVPL